MPQAIKKLWSFIVLLVRGAGNRSAISVLPVATFEDDQLPCVAPVEQSNVADEVPKLRAKRAKKEKSEIPQTLAELLDGIEDSFDALRLPDSRLSMIHKRDMGALRITGVHVPSPWVLEFDKDENKVTVDLAGGLPNTICIGTHGKSYVENDSDRIPPRLFFAIKQSKLPANVTACPGTPYIFGTGFALGDHKNDSQDKLAWLAMIGTIDKNGVIHFCEELRTKKILIPVTRSSDRKRYGKIREIPCREWSQPQYFQIQDRPLDQVRAFQKNIIRGAFKWWSGRAERWSVAVLKDRKRVTFGVDWPDTKRYFADRNKEIKAADGRAKKIIHHVREHSRMNANGKVSMVKEHIRGIRDFYWNGYRCIVTAPQFHTNGVLATSQFDVAPIDTEDLSSDVGYLDQIEVAKELVRIETEDRRALH